MKAAAAISLPDRAALRAGLPRRFLPAERDAPVGREAEIAELAGLLKARHLLVSVLGQGG